MKLTSTVPPIVRNIISHPLVQGVILLEPGKPPKFEGQWIAEPFSLSLWATIVAYFKKYPHDEVQVRLYYRPGAPAGERWVAHAHPQNGIGLSTKEDPTKPDAGVRPDTVPGTSLCGTIHSHCHANAFQSGTDKDNEVTQDGVHVTIGKVSSAQLDIHVRVYFQEFAFDLPNYELFGYDSASMPEIPATFQTPAVMAALKDQAAQIRMSAVLNPPTAEIPEVWIQNTTIGRGNGGVTMGGFNNGYSAGGRSDYNHLPSHYGGAGTSANDVADRLWNTLSTPERDSISDLFEILTTLNPELSPDDVMSLALAFTALMRASSKQFLNDGWNIVLTRLLEKGGKHTEAFLEAWRKETVTRHLDAKSTQQQTILPLNPKDGREIGAVDHSKGVVVNSNPTTVIVHDDETFTSTWLEVDKKDWWTFKHHPKMEAHRHRIYQIANHDGYVNSIENWLAQVFCGNTTLAEAEGADICKHYQADLKMVVDNMDTSLRAEGVGQAACVADEIVILYCTDYAQ